MTFRGRWSAMRFSSLLLALGLTACTYTIPTVAPRPTISLAPTNQGLALAFSSQIADVVDLPGGGVTMRITGLRASLANGFTAAFGRYYAPAGEGADLTLRLESVAPELVGGRMVLRFAARLDDRAGRTVGRSFGSLRATRQLPEDALAEALTMMFEKVAADCFVPLSIMR